MGVEVRALRGQGSICRRSLVTTIPGQNHVSNWKLLYQHLCCSITQFAIQRFIRCRTVNGGICSTLPIHSSSVFAFPVGMECTTYLSSPNTTRWVNWQSVLSYCFFSGGMQESLSRHRVKVEVSRIFRVILSSLAFSYNSEIILAIFWSRLWGLCS